MTGVHPDSPPAANDPTIGRLIDGRYQVRARIARGGMATVYLATDLRLERRVAIKIMHSHLADDSNLAQRFIQEARSAARLSHPNVVNVFDQGEDGETAYIVMEYLPGITLRELLKDYQRLTPEQTLDIMEAVLSGLAAAHRAGIVHRDVKPENVMLADDGRIKLADFGLARAASANTATGQALLGTIAYLSPELVSRGTADARSDIYALGIMLYEMLTGEQPYTGDAPMQIAYQHANSTVPAPSAIVPGTPNGFDELVSWMTQRDPEVRPADANEVLLGLRQLEDDIRAGTQSTRLLPRVDPAATGQLPATQVLGQGQDQETVAFGASATIAKAVAQVEHAGEAGLLARKSQSQGARRRWLLALVLVAAVLAGGVGWYMGHGPGSYLRVPNVDGSPAAVASAALINAGFLSETVEEYNPDVAQGTVISSTPAADSYAPRNSKVTLRVSLGPQMLDFPAVVGALEDTARQLLGRFTVAPTSQTEFSATEANGHVIQAVDASGNVIGAQYPEKGKVVLVVSLGPVPDVTGKTQADAIAALATANLTGKVVDSQFSDTVPSGSVISATPATDPIAPGGTVNLVISKGQQLVTVPDVSGQPMKTAIATLTAAGFNVNYAIDDLYLPIAVAVSTDPAAGQQVKPGTTINIKAQLTI